MAFTHNVYSQYGHCDTFFTESDDDIFAARQESRDRARIFAKARQRAIAEDLSRLTSEEYVDDILNHMETMEVETLPDVNSIDIQTEIQWFMRPYLLDFIVEAHAAFQLLPETLFLAVNLLDRYCSKRVVYKRHYQLVGCAALLIAAKYGDKKDRVPTIRELRSMCCSLYDEEMFTQMEWHVLQTLNWIIGHPSVDSFLQIALSEVAYDPELEHMAWYLCEIALFHKDFVSTKPSVMARSSLALARCILSRPQAAYDTWTGCYDPMTVFNLSNQLHQPSHVLQRKYASAHLSSVSTTVAEFLSLQAHLARQSALTPTSISDATSCPNQQKTTPNTYMNPQTPQKPAAAVMQHGCLTPPITPDSEVFGIHQSKKGYGLLPQITSVPPINFQQ